MTQLKGQKQQTETIEEAVIRLVAESPPITAAQRDAAVRILSMSADRKPSQMRGGESMPAGSLRPAVPPVTAIGALPEQHPVVVVGLDTDNA